MKTRTALPTRIPEKVKTRYAIFDAKSMPHRLMQVIDRVMGMTNSARRAHRLRQEAE